MSETQDRPKVTFKWPKMFLFFGVIMPIIALLSEVVVGLCAATFYDPIPTWAHFVLLACLPAWHLAVYRLLKGQSTLPPQWLWWGAGFCQVVALFYMLATFSISGLSFVFVIAVVTLPVCLLGVTPLFAWVAWFSAYSKMSSIHGRVPTSVWPGVAVAALALVLCELPTQVAIWQIKPAVQGDVKALERLRTFGSRSVLADICYRGVSGVGRQSPGTWLLSAGFSFPLRFNRSSLVVTPDEAREVFFKVTGKSFSSVKPSARREFGAMGFADDFGGWTWDGDRGGDVVGATQAGLSLKSSSLEWQWESASSLAYGEWTMEFHNASNRQQEARCHIRLPDEAVVSRLTLWVNGEPQEAAFDTRAKVTAAYKQVVKVERRDPVLVNHIGPGRVMMQCFPVPPDGGVMKVRLGITAPVSSGSLKLPQITERNYGLSSRLVHNFEWKAGGTVRREALDVDELASFEIKTDASPSSGPVWTEDKFATSEQRYLLRTLSASSSTTPKSLSVVIDMSKALAESEAEILKAAEQLPAVLPCSFFLATDGGILKATREELPSALRKVQFVGGRDTTAALLQALESAEQTGGEVVWLTGVHPVRYGKLTATQAPAFNGTIWAIDLANGPNRLVEWAADHWKMKAVNLSDHPERLASVLAAIVTGSDGKTFDYTRTATPPTQGTKVSDQLARYWAFQEALKTNDAALAARYQLVTPVSGAVVLETQAQYDRAGLKQADPSMVPNAASVPEPTSASMLALAWAWYVLQRRRRSCSVF
jgi:hypothetical protein